MANIPRLLLAVVAAAVGIGVLSGVAAASWQPAPAVAPADIAAAGSPDWLSAGSWFNGPFASTPPVPPAVIPRLIVQRNDGLWFLPLWIASPGMLVDISIFDVAPATGDVLGLTRMSPVGWGNGAHTHIALSGSMTNGSFRASLFPQVPVVQNDSNWFQVAFDNGYGPSVSAGSLLVTDVRLLGGNIINPSPVPLPASLWLLFGGVSVGCLFRRLRNRGFTSPLLK